MSYILPDSTWPSLLISLGLDLANECRGNTYMCMPLSPSVISDTKNMTIFIRLAMKILRQLQYSSQSVSIQIVLFQVYSRVIN